MTRVAHLADRLLHAVAVVLMLALLASVVLGVVSRQMNQPLSFTDELAQYLLVWTGIAGWMIASRRRGHIRILAFANLLFRGSARLALEIATQALVAFFGFAITWYSFGLIERNLDVESISVPFPAAALYAPLPLLGLCLLLQAIADAALALRRGRVVASEGQAL